MESRKKDIDARGLDTVMKEYLRDSDQYNTVFLIKIPKDYMCEVLHSDGRIDRPVPLFKKISDRKSAYESAITVFTPHLIQGCYNRTTDSFINNPNFSPIFDANGLQFSDEQKNSFRSLNKYDWYDFAKKRELLSFQDMYAFDKNNGFIDKTIQKYSQKYGRTYQSELYDQSQYAELLQNNRKGK